MQQTQPTDRYYWYFFVVGFSNDAVFRCFIRDFHLTLTFWDRLRRHGRSHPGICRAGGWYYPQESSLSRTGRDTNLQKKEGLDLGRAQQKLTVLDTQTGSS
jgi:hypothetical protein